MHTTLPLLNDTDFPGVRRGRLETLQVNLGYRCNQSCLHCHVNAGPARKEQMSAEMVSDVISFLRRSKVPELDLTGGAPEMHPAFRYLVTAAHDLGVRVTDRCNLTILEEPGFESMAGFLADHQVKIVASLPCYQETNVESQRGKGVYATSIRVLKKLNALGYGKPDSGLELNLMYNPVEAVLPPPQEQLEADYRRELRQRAGIRFNHLFVLANMPIQRFGSTLISRGEFHEYMRLLRSAHRQANLATVMCRTLVSVDWQGYVYDCDFNQMLNLPLRYRRQSPTRLRELDVDVLASMPVRVADHCYGCTAGQGSSCNGAVSV
jgi:radical SAM/Cys-rich protein